MNDPVSGIGLALVIAGLALSTLVTRTSFLVAGARLKLSHRAEVALRYAPVCTLSAIIVPDVLFHGTASRFLAAILGTGLDKRQRHHVHLTHDPATARAVGQRYGAPVVLEIDAARLCTDGHVFYRSANGVWLVDHVPPAYLKVHTTESQA